MEPMEQDTDTPLRLLAVEDDATDRSWLELMLKDATVCGYMMRFVGTMADAEQAIAAGNYDCVLLDLSLPDCDGLESVRRVHAARPSLPIVVFTGRKEQHLGLGAIEAGAQDYLVKGQASGNTILQSARWASARLSMRRDEAAAPVWKMPRLGEAWVSLAIDLTLSEVNDAFLRLVGAYEAEVIGRPLAEFLPPEDAARVMPLLLGLVAGAGGESVVCPVRLRHRLGHWLDRTLVATPVASGAVPESPTESLFVLLAASPRP